MRCVLLAFALVACGPKVSPQPLAFDEELGTGARASASSADADARPGAPPGPGRRTGTIARDRLIAVLDQGPGAFLRELEVTPRLDGQRFVGWELVQVRDRTGPLADVDLLPGDVLLAINGQPVARPDQLQRVWDSLRTANVVHAQLWRGATQLSLEFTIEPPVTPSPGQPATPAAAR
jgi:hypothetical protein